MNELALFAGAGGGILGGKLLGWRTVCAVERDAFAAAVLAQRQNDGCIEPFPIWSDVETFDGEAWRGIVDVVSGGFPCQDISAAGKGAGITGERSGLWREFARIIGEVRPRYVLVENSPVLTSRGLGTVLGDLAALGYDARWGVLGAVHAGAPHKRERIWIVAESMRDRCESGDGRELVSDQDRHSEAQAARWQEQQPGIAGASDVADADGAGCEWTRPAQPAGRQHAAESVGAGEDVADANIFRREPLHEIAGSNGESDGWKTCSWEERRCAVQPTRKGWWSVEPELGRVADGVAHRVERLRAIGNGQVPAVVRLAWHTLAPDK